MISKELKTTWMYKKALRNADAEDVWVFMAKDPVFEAACFMEAVDALAASGVNLDSIYGITKEESLDSPWCYVEDWIENLSEEDYKRVKKIRAEIQQEEADLNHLV